MPSGMGPVFERLRRLPFYKESRHILCPPVADCFQIRLNALSDGKLLTIPTPGLTKGFIQLDPKTIPPAQRFQAARLFPDASKGMRVPYDRPVLPPIDLVVAEALCADMEGHILGDGSGHLDLQVAILIDLNWLSPDVALLAVVSERDVLPVVPSEGTDVRVHWILTSERAVRSSLSGFPHAAVDWAQLDPRRIRRNAALFYLRNSLRKEMC